MRSSYWDTDRRQDGGSEPGPARLLALAIGILLLTPGAGYGGEHECGHPYYWDDVEGYSPEDNNCFGPFGFRCYQGQAGTPYFQLESPTCDPTSEACVVHLRVPFEFPGIIDMVAEDGLSGSPTPRIFWFDEATAGSCSGPFEPFCSPEEDIICGTSGFGGKIGKDFIETWVEKAGVTCDNADEQTGDYSIRAVSCYTACRVDEVVEGMTFDTPMLALSIGCPPPPPPDDCADQAPGMCCTNGVGPGGGPPAGAPGGGPGDGADTGGGAYLHYRAGGVGGPDLPGTSAWNTELGRYWSHSYAMRIVIDPDTGTDDHVWLLTSTGSFREFEDLVSGEYTTVSPSDEYRTLTRTSGWELTELDGTVHSFDSNGRWTQTVDRNGNAKVATYTSGELTSVEFPDGREEEFTYSSGRLATITEIGVDGTSELEWEYTWSGLDLVRVDRPDGTAIDYTYGDTNFPGYITLVELLPTSGSARVLRGYEYDEYGNVVDQWRGASSPTDPDAVDRWQYSFDNPLLPSETEVTDPLGNVETYFIGRDEVSRKPKLLAVEGDCPVCGIGPGAQLHYDDTAHPLRPTRILDFNGNETRFEYTDFGRAEVRIEAYGTSLERTTEWDYDANFPALVIEKRRPSIEGGTEERITTWDRDSVGNATEVSIEGFEDGSSFLYTTEIDYNDDTDGGGQPESIDPPGYSTDDEVTFTYHSRGNGNLILASRTDPLIGDTDYGYDAFNRRARVIDPNGVAFDTRYDELDRVTHRIHRVTDSLPVNPPDPPETIQAGDLVTENVYDAYGDLDHTILPEGNVVDYGYDDAGRLISLERRPNLSTHGERILYTLDDAGNRTREDLQVWDSPGSDWETRSFTLYHFDTRCHLDRIEDADGEITEYAYDCNGNLEKVWDANHPSSGQTAAATQVYAYDELDRLVSMTQPWTGSGGGSAVTSYDYDVQDHLVEVTDGEGNVTAYQFSDRDLVTAEVSEFLATGGSCGTFPDCSQNGCGCKRMSYNEHGELEETTDARGVTVERTIDELDRVTLIEYPDSDLDTEFEYDDAGVDFSKGRLTAILRHGETHAMAYDRFGRVTQDGDAVFDWDENGNRTEITFGTGSSAKHVLNTYDFADREATLDYQIGTSSADPVVTDAVYEPFGPLAELSFDNSIVETRLFDDRYMPGRITAVFTSRSTTLLDWDYTTDDLGNPTAIEDLVDSGNDREFAYQDVHYFLTCYGPSSTQFCYPPSGQPEEWTYDKIGNRLSETAAGSTTTYTYATNGASGNTPLLTDVGSDDYDYDEAGNLIEIAGTSSTLDLTYDDESRLAETAEGSESVDLLYDGRSFLLSSDRTIDSDQYLVSPYYSSDGRLLRLVREFDPGGPSAQADTHDVMYFAGRPVAIALSTSAQPTAAEVSFYTTDHRGAPVLITSEAGEVIWQDKIEPFGAAHNSIYEGDIFLRLPGQWEDETWRSEDFFPNLHYNVHRWYQPTTGRYTRPDPLGPTEDGASFYSFAFQNPLVYIDPAGLFALAPGEKCKGFPRAFAKIQQLKVNCRCANFFRTSLGADLAELIDGPLPLVRIGPRVSSVQRGGRTRCEAAPNEIEVSRDFCNRLFGRKRLKHALLHELAHWADCGPNRFPAGGPTDEGALAEIWCFGETIDEDPVSDLFGRVIGRQP